MLSDVGGICEHSVLEVARYEVDQVLRDSDAMKRLQDKVPVGKVKGILYIHGADEAVLF